MNFDPNTGEPIQNDNLINDNNVSIPENNTIVENIPIQPAPIKPEIMQPTQLDPEPAQPVQPEPAPENVETPQMVNTVSEEALSAQDSVKGIPTIEQNDQSFVANTQAISSEKKSDDKSRVNYALILILLGVVVAAIFFGFPLLQKLFK